MRTMKQSFRIEATLSGPGADSESPAILEELLQEALDRHREGGSDLSFFGNYRFHIKSKNKVKISR